ncbi:MAG: hypothetical protein F4X80_05045 [Chloroflexi bacterium]|nr:hypothetical protein [Chloroflexota bacterium]MYE32015.1 hypothetical protein [Chloroflexota bacterium]
MDWRDTPEQAASRQEVPALIDDCLPELPPGVASRMRDDGAVRARGRRTVNRASDDTERQGFE